MGLSTAKKLGIAQMHTAQLRTSEFHKSSKALGVVNSDPPCVSHLAAPPTGYAEQQYIEPKDTSNGYPHQFH